MLTRAEKDRTQAEIIILEDLVPSNHLLRKIEAAVDFSQIYGMVEKMYCLNNGRPSIDPVVLVKMVLLQHLYGIPSLRRTAEEVKLNVAYRWFLGYRLTEDTPHFATVSYNFKHRFTSATTESLFQWILTEIGRTGYLTPEAVFLDGTHIKANANIRKIIKKTVPQAAKSYERQLREEINADREEHGKSPFDDDDTPPEETLKSQSTTDPGSGVFHKGEHKKCLAYTAQTACDKHGYVLGVTVNAGNIHDSVAFDGIYDKITTEYPQINAVVADAGYKTPWICKKVIDDHRIPVLPYTRPKSKLEYRKYDYVYDEYYDCVLCPQNQILGYSTTNKEGYREYKSRSYVCGNCETRAKCTSSTKHEKIVCRHIWEEYMERADDFRYMPEYRALYERRKETIERVFADAKEKHGMRYTPYRGLTQVTNWVKLKFAAMNLKKFAVHLWNDCPLRRALLDFHRFFVLSPSIHMKEPLSRLRFGVL